MEFTQSDTICAISTPPGMGAIAVIRLSGPRSEWVVNHIFRPREKGLDLLTIPSHTAHLGTIGNEDEILDEVLLTLYRSPHSYTGEDIIEISCHGSPYVQQKLIGLLLDNGVRLADRGEFTLRAFMNGKFDLSQAEAVADLIASNSKSSHDLAVSQMRGGFSKKIKALRSTLLDFATLIELELDFSEENVEFASRPELQKLLAELTVELTSLINSFSVGNVIKNGIPVAIIGKPNVGKSTLLNTLLNEEKAIVSEVPGTTRDAIEDSIVIGEHRFRFIDTAGLRESSDHIEKIGIERTWEKIRSATIILYVFDASEDNAETVNEDVSGFRIISDRNSATLILIGNKADKLSNVPSGFKDLADMKTIFVSAKQGENIHLIGESLTRSVRAGNWADSPVVTNIRHAEALKNALFAVNSISAGLTSGLSPELLTSDIRVALHHLGEITGEITTDEILGNIFNRFCIGK